MTCVSRLMNDGNCHQVQKDERTFQFLAVTIFPGVEHDPQPTEFLTICILGAVMKEALDEKAIFRG